MARLTEEDLANIAVIVQEVVENKEKEIHPCRFSTIKPEDLADMVEAHKKFKIAMEDSKGVVRRFIIVLVLTTLSGLIGYGYWARMAEAAKKTITP